MSDDFNFELDARSEMPSLVDPEVANAALEAFVDGDDRLTGGLAFLFCDRDGRLMQPVLISELPHSVSQEDRWAALRWATGLCEMVDDEHTGPLGLVAAVVRESGPVCDEDRQWHQVALDACAEVGAPLIGMHVVTMDGAVALPTAPEAAEEPAA